MKTKLRPESIMELVKELRQQDVREFKRFLQLLTDFITKGRRKP